MSKNNLSTTVYCSDCGEELVFDCLTQRELRIFKSGIDFILWPRSLQQKWEEISWASDPFYLCPSCFEVYGNLRESRRSFERS
jgi:hypothetical protein